MSQLFFYKPLFLAELLIAELIFTHKLRRRSHFFLRLLVSAVLCALFAFSIPLAHYTVAYNSAIFFSIFAATLAALCFCFDESGWNLLFCALVSYTVQHIAFVVNSTIVTLFRLDVLLEQMGSAVDPYSNAQASGLWNPLLILCYVDCYILIYWYFGYFLSRRMEKGEDLSLGRKPLIVLSGLLVAVDIVFNLVTVMNTQAGRGTILLENTYNIICCLLALVLQFGTLTRRKLAQSNELLQQMLVQKEQQYEIRRESMELIDIKYHDLKHQLRLLREQVDAEDLRGMEAAVDRYRTTIQTGNNALDIVLMEKTMLCQKKDISFSVIADGAPLAFLPPTELYSLFGNALENAMEYLETLADTEKRFLHLSVKQVDQLVVIHAENYYDGPDVELGGRLPQTTKPDQAYHGFGMRSMQMIAEKYGGQLSVQVRDHLFTLNILLPLPQGAVQSK